MKKSFIHITGAFFLGIFLLSWVVTNVPLSSLEFFKADPAELVAKTESEHSEKEKEEKITEKNLIHQATEQQLHAWQSSDSKNSPWLRSCHWLNVYLPIFTPPPEKA